jgi:hypothetical protein
LYKAFVTANVDAVTVELTPVPVMKPLVDVTGPEKVVDDIICFPS